MKVTKLNKILIISTLILSNFLTGCATKNQIEIPVTKEDIYINKVVVAQICIPKFNYIHDYISGNIINENEWSTYIAPLQGITKSYQYIFQANLGNPLHVNYYTVTSNESENNFVYKRDFTKYKIDIWSKWENFDVVLSRNQITSLSLQDKVELSSSIIIPTLTEIPKVRFKIMRFNEYLNQIEVKQYLLSQKGLDNC